jgi:hypothetical protein
MPIWTPLFLSLAALLDAQPHAHDAAHPGLLGSYPATREASGTSWQPEAAPMEGVHLRRGAWTIMVHGFAFGVYGGHTGRRRDDEAYTTNMVMAMASRPAAGGTLGLRAMLSLEPVLGPRGYPLLLQTGETADGREHLFDRQHPHDFAMELALTWSRPLGARSSVFAYLGLPGEPALGPAAFMHRPSAMDMPAAPLAHHWLDSTHITHGVATLGVTAGKLKLDASAFRGRESDQHRWNVERPRLDSFAFRATFNPSPAWSLQASLARIEEPEILHPDLDVKRFTLSAARSASFGPGRLESLLAVGRNVRSRLLSTSPFTTYPPTRSQDAVLLESTLRWPAGHAVLARLEWVEKDELFIRRDAFHVRTFPVAKLDLGAVRELVSMRRLSLGLGFTAGVHRLPEVLEGEYGRRPWAYTVFARVRLR